MREAVLGCIGGIDLETRLVRTWELGNRTWDAGTLVNRCIFRSEHGWKPSADLASDSAGWHTTDKFGRCPGPHRSAGVPLGDRIEHMFACRQAVIFVAKCGADFRIAP
jgi:hypothetical protein